MLKLHTPHIDVNVSILLNKVADKKECNHFASYLQNAAKLLQHTKKESDHKRSNNDEVLPDIFVDDGDEDGETVGSDSSKK